MVDDQDNVTTIDWVYDELGRLIEERYDFDDANDVYDDDFDYLARYTFDLASNRWKVVKDTGNANPEAFAADEVTKYNYDENDRLTREVFDHTSNNALDTTTFYEYDVTEQIRKTTYEGLLTSETGTKKSETFQTYTIRGRLESVQVNEDATGGYEQVFVYQYNDAGIRVSQTDMLASPDEVTIFLVDANNPTGYAQVLAEGVDDDGNGRLDWRRVGEVVVSEHDTSYTLGHDILAQQNDDVEDGDTLQLVYDGHGSTRAVVKETVSGIEVLQRYAYDAYGVMQVLGNVTVDAPTALTRFLYSGEQTDATGLQYLRARYYDPLTGRFNSLDPYAGNVRDPNSLHKYLYTHGNPIMGVDPTGEMNIVTSLASFSIRAALTTINVARTIPIIQVTTFRVQYWLLANLWKIELATIIAAVGLEATSAGANWIDSAIGRALSNDEIVTDMDGGGLFERVTGATGTGYQGIDHISQEADGKVSVMSLGSRGGNPDVDDELFISRVKNTLTSKAKTVSTQRQFEPRLPGQPSLMPEQVVGRAAIVAIPETRAHLIQDQRMISMLRQVQSQMKNVRTLVVPLRGWRPR